MMTVEERSNYNKAWRLAHPDYFKLYIRKKRKYDPEKYREYYLSNKEEILEKNKKWRQDNKEKWSYSCSIYRHNKRAGGKIDKDAWKEKCESLGNQCQICGSCSRITIDHILPVSKGGTNDIHNLQPLCLSCNSRKCDKVLYTI